MSATAIALLAKYGPMAAQFFGSQFGLKKEAEQQDAIISDLTKASKTPQFGVGSSWNKFLSMSRQDPAADMLRQQQQAAQASNIGAMKAGGAKAIIGAGTSMANQAARQRAQIEADSFNRQQDALQTYAGVDQTANQLNTRYRLGMEDRIREAQQAKTDAQDARTQGWFDLAGGVLGQFGQGDLQGLFDKGENGMKVRQTPGRFSHASNPIDIVRKGRKIGEMTGGEAIFNPSQTRNMESMAMSGNSDLHRYMRNLFRQFNNKR